MSASVAHSFESITSVPPPGDSATARYGLDERKADHFLRSIRNARRSDVKTQMVNRDSSRRAAQMLLKFSELPSYHLAHFLVHDFVYRQVASQVGTRQWANLSGAYQGSYAALRDELKGPTFFEGFSTVRPESQRDFLTFVSPLKLPRMPATFLFQGPYAARLSELKELAIEEGISPVMPESQRDFLSFVSTREFTVRRASLSLLDGGALGATWRNEQWRLSLRFHGDGHVGYVLLDRTNPPAGATGKCELNNFSIDCENLDLTALLTE